MCSLVSTRNGSHSDPLILESTLRPYSRGGVYCSRRGVSSFIFPPFSDTLDRCPTKAVTRTEIPTTAL